MPKKRNCRRSDNEKAIHDRAVALRKMTDQQLVDYVDHRATAKPTEPKFTHNQWEICERILETLANTKGIGASTITKVRAAIMEVAGENK